MLKNPQRYYLDKKNDCSFFSNPGCGLEEGISIIFGLYLGSDEKKQI
jgi:hypothetical protein